MSQPANPIAFHKTSVAATFGAASETYEASADVQRNVAKQLTTRILKLPLPRAPRILEIGCGTGFLTRNLIKGIPHAKWTITDISSQMLAQCRAGMGSAHDISFRVMDGEKPKFQPDECFDLICSSLAFQWFENFSGALKSLAASLAPGGHIAFATLAEDSFREWRRAHAKVGAKPSILRCLPLATIRQAFPPSGVVHVKEEHISQPYSNGYAFLKKLRQIGADMPAKGRYPSPPGTLRRVLRSFDSDPEGCMTYHIVYGVFTQN